MLRLILCGVYQPPIRAGALRVIVSQTHGGDDCVVERCRWVCARVQSSFVGCLLGQVPDGCPFICPCRNPAGCDKNWIRYYRNDADVFVEMVLAHFKNDSIKGTQVLPLSELFQPPLVCLEQAHEYLARRCPTLWFNTKGVMYSTEYWSTVCSKVSWICGTHG